MIESAASGASGPARFPGSGAGQQPTIVIVQPPAPPAGDGFAPNISPEELIFALEILVMELEENVAARQSQPGAPAGITSCADAGGNAPDAPAGIDQLIQREAAKNGIDPALVKAVVANESGFNPHATSACGAEGLMQLMPGTASAMGATNAYDPAQNIAAGTKYLAQQLRTFGGDVSKAVAAYNAGPGAVEQYGGIPPYAETRTYVANVLSDYAKYRA